MDLTQGTVQEKNARARKMMLWFGIVSLIMGFAGWTSAYIVSSAREDWVSELNLPTYFYVSTAIIILSSFTYILAKKAIAGGDAKSCTTWLWVTLALGGAFIFFQFQGFAQMVADGYYFTGPTSNIKLSYVFLIAMVHIVHVAVGIISLLVVLYQQIKGKYTAQDYLGLSLGATFWHFLDLLWLYLIVFMSTVG
ncbi:cytochrome c oxidase subunit 3 [Maribacter sp. 2307ULW6-5]|uniref:cytochrome c oxidase subunit 3 n=1 Tax=Maribacter sp. 2307ULW6-5 TaxID=3386275 RepID=UPI0039BC2C31